MIYVDMQGRLGNQMFRYAFARQLQKKNPEEEIICNYEKVLRFHKTDKDGWENSLRFFNTKYGENEGPVKKTIIQRLINKVLVRKYYPFLPRYWDFQDRFNYDTKWAKILQHFGLYYFYVGYFPFKRRWWNKNIVVDTCSECDKYFSGIRNILLEEFTPKYPLLSKNQKIYDLIKNRHTICVSIRTYDEVKAYAKENPYGVCSEKYFYQAMSYMNEHIENPLFYICSDDIEKIKRTFNFPKFEIIFEDGTNPVWEKLRLMNICEHFIISNSTFSWWAQYLSQNDDKIVIAPQKWFDADYTADIFQDNWLLMES